MNSINFLAGRMALVAALVVPAVASAAIVTINSTTPTWSNVVGGGSILLNQANGAYTDVRWGTSGGSGQSGLGFDPTNPPATDYTVNTQFLLGTLQHYNNPIAGGTAASSVDLGLATVVAGATPASQAFSFRFAIDETPNVAPCTYPSTTHCADRITFANLDLSSAFLVGGVNYTIELIGFSGNGGATLASFFDSQEGGTNSVGLYAQITEASKVPEPGSLALVGLALLGATVARRKA